MIISAEEVRQHITTKETDAVLEAKLQALEIMIREHTNNNFQNRNIRCTSSITNNRIDMCHPLIKEGDTIQISQSRFNDGLYVYKKEGMELADEQNVRITKIVYPADVKMGIINLLKWDLKNRDKVGIQSETLSRHSITYFNMDGQNAVMGYPKVLLDFLGPYQKAGF